MSEDLVENSTSPRFPSLTSRGWGHGLGLVLVFALVVRLTLIAGNIADHPWFFFQDLEKVEEEISSTEEPYMNAFGFEASNIAHAWVCAGQGYASPFGGTTGPTAWIAPGVVVLYAVSFALWGCFTFKSILFVFFVALVVSLFTTVAVFRIGERVGGDPNVGFLAALFFACLPFEAWIFQIAGHLDFNLQVLWFAVLLLAILRAMDSERPISGLELGAVSAVAALFNPGLLLGTGVGFLFVIRGRSWREIGRLTLFLTLAHLVVLGPYVVFQSLRLGGFVPVKSNASFELYLGNTPEANGVLQDVAFQAHHPSQNATEFVTYGGIGEIEYLGDAQRRFREEFQLSDFLRITVRRTFYFFLAYQVKPWDSSPFVSAIKAAMWAAPVLSLVALVAVRGRRLSAEEGAMLLFTLAYVVPYLVTGIMERYRIPIVPTVAVVLALLVWTAMEGWWGHKTGKTQ
jgi:hypothetical protein